MYIVRKYENQIDRFICSGSRAAFLRAFVLLVIVLAALGALIFKLGSPAMNGRPWDSPTPLNGAWRIAMGQVPHRDFYNYLGDLPFYMTCLGMKISRPCASAIDYGNVITMVMVALPALAVLRRRTSALSAFIFSLFIGLLVITPRPLGDTYDYIDHAMLYNRYGEAFIALFGIIIFLPPKAGLRAAWADRAEAVLAGFALTALLGCKLNYFALGLGFLAVAFVTGRIRFEGALLCVISAAAFLAVALALTKIPLMALINDYRTLSGSESAASRIRGVIIQGLKSIVLLPVLLLAVWEDFLGETKSADQRQSLWRNSLVIVAIYGGAVLLLSTNCQMGEMPLLALAALCGAEMVQRREGPAGETNFFFVTRHLGALLLFSVFLLPPILGDLKTIRFAASTAIKKNWDSPEALQSTYLNDFRFVRDGTRRPDMKNYMDELNEGVELLRRHTNSEMRLNGLLFSDPYHVALGLVPAKGGTISLALDGMNKKSHQPLEQLIGNATHLLTARDSSIFHDAYGADWDALHLEVVEETKTFTLFKVPQKLR